MLNIPDANSIQYNLNFRDVVTYDPDELNLDQEEIRDIEKEDYIFNIEINSAVSRICEKVFYHWPVVRRIYGEAGEKIMTHVAFWNKKSILEKLDFRGFSQVSIEEFISALEILKLFYNPEEPANKYARERVMALRKDLYVVFKAMVNSLKEIKLPPELKFRINSLCEDINILQEFLNTYREDKSFRDSFIIYKDTLFKKCMSMAQYVALLNTNDNLLCIGPGSIAKSSHGNITTHDGRKLGAEVGHGFTDFLAIDLGQRLPDDTNEREEEIERRLNLVRDIRKNSDSYDIKDAIRSALKCTKHEILNVYIWELKIHNQKPKKSHSLKSNKKLLQNYQAQTGGYTEKTRVAIANDPELSSHVNLLNGLVIVTPEETIVDSNISGYIFVSRLEEMVKNLDSITTLYDRPHFKPREVEGRKKIEHLSFQERKWLEFQEKGASIIIDESDFNFKTFEPILLSDLGIYTIFQGHYLTSDGFPIEDEDGTSYTILRLASEELGREVVALRKGSADIKNNGVIWINKGWSEEAKSEARANGFNVQESNTTVLAPEFIGKGWALKFVFPRTEDNLTDLFKNRPTITTADLNHEMLLIAIEEKNASMQGELNLSKVRELRAKRKFIEGLLAEQTEKPPEIMWNPGDYKQQAFEGFNAGSNYYIEG